VPNALELTPDLPPALVPVAWLLGTWQGAGVIGYPGQPEAQFGQQVVFAHHGGDYLTYDSRLYEIDAEGTVGAVMTVETGYWRPVMGGSEVEAIIAQPGGVVEVYVGPVTPARIELTTDIVARTLTADEHQAGHRLYGLVQGDLLYAYDKAAYGQPMSPHASARLRRVEHEQAIPAADSPATPPVRVPLPDVAPRSSG
jgi:THAP4-like, heme-binding beta-barrel domain